MSAGALLIAELDAFIALLEAPGEYTYEDVTLKRWELGPGGRTGNCDGCVENADSGELEESEFFPAPGPFGYVDEPPLHPSCLCFVTYRDTRRRVAVDDSVV